MAEQSLLTKIIRKGLVETKQHVEIQVRFVYLLNYVKIIYRIA